MTDETALIPVEAAELRVRVARDTRVILDADLAALYGVETCALVQAARRNPDRFPPDFMFELTPDEWAALRSATPANDGLGGRQTPPLAFRLQRSHNPHYGVSILDVVDGGTTSMFRLGSG